MCSGLSLKVSVINLYDGNITRNELTVQLSPGNVELRVYDDLLNWQNDPVVFLGVCGGVPLPALHFRISASHFDSLGIGATGPRVRAEIGAHVGAATVRNNSAVF